MKTKIYKCYGILAHEKEIIYSTNPSETCEEIEINIPRELEPYEAEDGTIYLAARKSARSYNPMTLAEGLREKNIRNLIVED